MKSSLPGLLLMTALVASAQQKPTELARQSKSELGQQRPTSEVQPVMTPQPGKEMQRLLGFVGTWSLSEKYEPTDGMPSGGVGQGQQIWRPGPGRLSLIEEYRSENSGGKIFGLSVTWWDEEAQGYRALWCVNTNPRGCTIMASLAKWEENQFVLGDQFEMNGKKFAFKEVVSDITPTSFTQTLYQGEVGGELKRSMTIRATKVTTSTKRP